MARDHGFTVNQLARRLRTRQNRGVGIVFPVGDARRQHLSDPFFMMMLAHLGDGLTEIGYDMTISRIVPEDEHWLDRVVDSGLLDGVLLIGQSNQFEAIERVARRYRPLVAWGVHTPGQLHCAIGTDNAAGGRLAGETLIAAGAKRIAFMGDVDAPEFRQRLEGVADAIISAGLEQPLQLLPTPSDVDVMDEYISRHIEQFGNKIDGIAAASDVTAMTALRFLKDRGIAVPEEVRVVGYDDIPLASRTIPRLTTIRQNVVAGVGAMIEALVKRIGGEETTSVQMAPFLVRRDST